MKKILFLLLASFLALAACGQEEKSEDKKETKASDKESKKDDKEKEKADKKSNKEVVTQDENKEQSQAQTNTQEQQPVQLQEQEPGTEEQNPVQQYPTDQEVAEANAQVAKQHGFTGIPNGDAHISEEELAEREAYADRVFEEMENIDESELEEADSPEDLN